MNKPGEPPVFIVGMPRSGTTVTETLLDAHPELALAPETHFLQRWMRDYADADLDDEETFSRFWKDYSSTWHFTGLGLDPEAARERILAVRPVTFRSVFERLLTQYAEREGKRRWGEKTPGHFRHLDTIFDWFPDAQIIFMVRDPRAMAASRATLDVEWSQRPVDVLALGWLDSVRVADRWRSAGSVRVTHYEELVRNPEGELRSICEFLGVEFSEAMLEDRAPEGETRPYGDLKPKSAVTAQRIDRWREVLSPDDIAIIEHICRPAMVAHGYEPVTTALSGRQRARLAWMTTRRTARHQLRRRRVQLRRALASKRSS